MKSQLIAFICIIVIVSLSASPALGGCGRWVIRDNTDFLTDPVFDQAVASSTGASATVNPDGTQRDDNKTEETSAKDASSGKAVDGTDADVMDLAGKWRIDLNNGLAEQNDAKSLDLILIQTGDRIQGYGTVIEGGVDIPATATGTISKDDVSLDVKLTQQKKDYRLDMSLIKSDLLGSYELYDMESLSENGNATARRSD